MRALSLVFSAAGAAALMLTGCGGTPFAVAPPDPGATAATPQQLEGPEGSAAADPPEAAPAVAEASQDAGGPGYANPAEASVETPEAALASDSASLADVSPPEASPPVVDASHEAGPSSDGGPPVLGNWIYTNAPNTDGYVLSLKSDDTYTLQRFVRTSTSTANDQIETGSFSVSAHAITFVPAQWSCQTPDPAYITPFALTGGYIDVTYGIGLVAFHADTASSDFTPVVGCFAKSGAFAPSPVAPVAP